VDLKGATKDYESDGGRSVSPGCSLLCGVRGRWN
jgi:hypothetical protein